jgi:hypothetical protein
VRYEVFVDDNARYMDDSHRRRHGAFADAADAVLACRSIVDAFFETANLDCTADELFAQYCTFGDDPFIVTDDASCTFSARQYAKARCHALARRR